MKKIALLAVIAGSLATSLSAWAGKDDHVIIQEAVNNHVQVAQAIKLADETAVTLTGTLVKQIDAEKFELKDATGTILLEIDDDISRATPIKVGDKVIISCVTTCGSCDDCKKGLFANCPHGGWIIGHLIDDTHAEYVHIPYAVGIPNCSVLFTNSYSHE